MLLLTIFISILEISESVKLPSFDLPDPKNVALMARFVVHKSNWTSVSYISHDNESQGKPMAALFSVSDGPQESGDGIPYFYVSPLQAAVTDLTNNNANCSLLMSLAQTSICKENNWDPEDPRCAQVILSGTFQKIQNTSEEYPKAKEAIFSRHPSFVYLPASHKFFLAKINIARVIVQDRFGGPSVVPVHDYFSVSAPKINATSRSCSLESNLLILALLLEIIDLYFNL